jgi:hypothetical protein
LKKSRKPSPLQLELPLSADRPRQPARPAPGPDRGRAANGLRLITGEGRGRPERLESRQSVVRVLVEAGADLLLRRISTERAGEIQRAVDQVLRLFDAVDNTPALLPVLRRELEKLEALMTQTRSVRGRRSAGAARRGPATDV